MELPPLTLSPNLETEYLECMLFTFCNGEPPTEPPVPPEDTDTDTTGSSLSSPSTP